MARTNKANLSKQGEFKHGTSIGENGEILYDMPIEVKDDQDLRNYGITESDCRFLPFGSSKKVKVFFFKTPDRSFAEAEWERPNLERSARLHLGLSSGQTLGRPVRGRTDPDGQVCYFRGHPDHDGPSAESL